MELLDVYDINGEKTGKIIERNDIYSGLKEGEYVAIAQIFIENDKGEFLIEQSAKKTGNRFLPAGGHISSGENAYETIIREVKEELGLDLSNENVVDLGFIHCDERLRNIFYLKKNIDLSELTFQKEEVLNVSYMSIDKIKEFVDEGLMHPSHNIIIKKILEFKSKVA